MVVLVVMVVVVVVVALVTSNHGVRKPGRKTGKQHGLACSPDPFLRHIPPVSKRHV